MNAASRRVVLEVAVASAEDAEAAQQGGADRVELNSALLLGGLTPSLGSLIEARARVQIPIIVMVRPRGGGFAYTDREFAGMQRDVDFSLEHGASGIAFGILTGSGTIDEPRTRKLVEQIGSDRQSVFHRAFDVTPDPFEAMQTLIDLGVRRVMTSGQEDSAYNGASLIAELIARSVGRLEILPAGGINRFTLEDVLRRTGCDQVHASLKTTRHEGSTASRPGLSFGGTLRPPEDRYETTDPTAVAMVRLRLDRS